MLGNNIVAKQGAATSDFSEAYDITITGQVKQVDTTIATAGALTVYDASVDSPSSGAIYGWIMVDQIAYLQLITAATNVVIKIAANQPFVLPGYFSMLAAASTTAITGAAEPTTAAITKIVVGNYSGSTLNIVGRIIK